MITNFEEITHELSYEEKKALPHVISALRKHNSLNPVKAPALVEEITRDYPITLSEVRLRKIVNYIRAKHLLPVIGTSKGYYVSFDRSAILRQVQSLQDRADAIMVACEGLKYFIQ